MQDVQQNRNQNQNNKFSPLDKQISRGEVVFNNQNSNYQNYQQHKKPIPSQPPFYPHNQQNQISKRFFLKGFIILIITLILFLFANYYLLTTYISSQIASINNSTNETIINDPLKSNAEIQQEGSREKSLTSFLNTSSISEVDYKVEATSNYIQNFDDQNCKTPITPPAKNGCGFVLLPYSLNIPQEGTYLKSLKVYGDLNEGDKIVLNTKDYESGQLSEEIAVIERGGLERSIDLPGFMKKTEGLYFRFWTPGGQAKITRIVIDYFSIDDFKKVRGIIKDFKEKNSTKINILEIYRDKDENGVFNPKKDTPWVCTPNFPGVGVEIDEDGVFKILREDSCYNGLDPNKFSGDNKEYSLPPGKWLLVINKEQSYDFEIDENQKNDDFLELEF